MTDLRGLRGWPWSELWAGVNAGQHLALDAVVAFVDGELSLSAHERAAAHVAGCATCSAEVAAQRQARSAVRSAHSPATPAALLAALQAIPERAALPADGPAATRTGAVVAGPLRSGNAPLGTRPGLGGARFGAAGLGPGDAPGPAPQI
jgi:anti-sigma factor RsiW